MSMRFKGGVVSAASVPTASPVTIDVLVVGGGGGAGYSGTSPWNEGAGGAGGYLYFSSVVLTGAKTYVVTVGPGGFSNDNYYQQGGTNSVFIGPDVAKIAIGGGSGGYDGGSGGSGGGAGWNGTGGSGTTGQGYAGANGGGYYAQGSGGGGSGGAGSGSTGGGGTANSISGSSVTYAVGGTVNTGGYLSVPANNVPFSGNGGNGNGASGYPYAANGDYGVVIIRYSTSYARAYATTGYPVYASSGGYHIYTFQSSGTISF